MDQTKLSELSIADLCALQAHLKSHGVVHIKDGGIQSSQAWIDWYRSVGQELKKRIRTIDYALSEPKIEEVFGPEIEILNFDKYRLVSSSRNIKFIIYKEGTEIRSYSDLERAVSWINRHVIR